MSWLSPSAKCRARTPVCVGPTGRPRPSPPSRARSASRRSFRMPCALSAARTTAAKSSPSDLGTTPSPLAALRPRLSAKTAHVASPRRASEDGSAPKSVAGVKPCYLRGERRSRAALGRSVAGSKRPMNRPFAARPWRRSTGQTPRVSGGARRFGQIAECKSRISRNLARSGEVIGVCEG